MGRTRTVLITSALFTLGSAGPALAGDLCGTWNHIPTPNPWSANNGLGGGVVPLAADDVWALGGGSNGNFFIRWDGTGWNEQAMPQIDNPGIGWGLDTISSVAPGELWTAGRVATSQWTTEQLLIRWNGADWDQEETLELEPQRVYPFAARHGAPRAMDGTGPDDIWIVGTASGWGDGVGGNVPMGLHWDGSELREVNALIVGNRQNHLYGVAAVAPDDVWAVGYYNNTGQHGGAFRCMIQHWDGSRWNLEQQPAETINQAFLHDVVAIAPDDIWAVGEKPGGALLMHYDGSRWTIAPSPTDVTSSIAKVAAIATDDIWAVSWFEPGYIHYDGTSWSLVGRPEIPGVQSVNRGGGLAAAGPCDVWSVGGVTIDSYAKTFAERLEADSGTPGDVNDDGVVNFGDILAILAVWGPCQDCPEDLDGDGVVGFGDILVVLANWS